MGVRGTARTQRTCPARDRYRLWSARRTDEDGSRNRHQHEVSGDNRAFDFLDAGGRGVDESPVIQVQLPQLGYLPHGIVAPVARQIGHARLAAQHPPERKRALWLPIDDRDRAIFDGLYGERSCQSCLANAPFDDAIPIVLIGQFLRAV